MPRVFNRIISFHVQGEIYDHETSPEQIIRNYNWNLKDSENGKIHIVASHKDNRGRITKMAHLPKIQKWNKPDTELFII